MAGLHVISSSFDASYNSEIHFKISPRFWYIKNNTNCPCILMIIKIILIIFGSWMYTRWLSGDVGEPQNHWTRTKCDISMRHVQSYDLPRCVSYVRVYLQGRTNLILKKCCEVLSTRALRGHTRNRCLRALPKIGYWLFPPHPWINQGTTELGISFIRNKVT